MKIWRRLAGIVAENGAAALVSVHEVKGSAPREAGARMIVRPDGAFHGTIGGGRLEWQALAWARDAMANRRPAHFRDQALGPDLGQCCGGRVKVLVETFDARDLGGIESLAKAEEAGPFEVACRIEDGRVGRRIVTGKAPDAAPGWRETYGMSETVLHLFGAGHVGRALVLALAPLPFRIRWIDTRDDAFPAHIPANAMPVQTRDPVAEIAEAPGAAFVLVMTHDHAIDLAVTAAALTRPFPFVGLIGSDTKRARFEARFRELGIPQERIRTLACPIGIHGISGKEPAVIAAATVAQLLQVRENVEVTRHSPSETLQNSLT